MKYDVYGTKDNWFFSKGITREFGLNKNVILKDGRVVTNVVQPYKEEWHNNLPVVGTIDCD